MSNYKIWLGPECSFEEAKHVLSLFEQLGYAIDSEWNQKILGGGIFDSAYTAGTPFNFKSNTQAECLIHHHNYFFKINLNHQEITIDELKALVQFPLIKIAKHESNELKYIEAERKKAGEEPDLEKLRSWISDCVTSKPQLNDKGSMLIVENTVEYLLDLLD